MPTTPVQTSRTALELGRRVSVTSIGAPVHGAPHGDQRSVYTPPEAA